jgi:hypothetical protein
MISIALLVAAVVLVYVLCSHPSRGLARLASPDSTALFILIAIFAVRPLFAHRLDSGFYGYTLDTSSVERAIAIGATCIGAFGLGAFFATARPQKQTKLAALPARARRRITITAGGTLLISILAVALYLVALLMLAGWNTVTALAGGRSAETSTAGLPEIILVLPLAGSISVSLLILARRGTSIKRVETVTLFACVTISLIMVSALGTRRFMIPAVLMPISAALIRRPTKLRPWHLAVGFVGLLFVAIVPMVRSAGARLPGENLLTASLRYASEQGIGGILEPIFASYDTEMLDYIALTASRIHAGWLSFGLGRGTLLEFVLRPVPASKLSQAPWSDEVLTNLWGGGCLRPYCPVGSVAGVTYLDGGFPLLIVGSFAFGFGLRWLATRWVYNRHLGDFQATVVAIASSFALVAARTNTVHAIWWWIYTLIIAWLIYRVFSDRVEIGPPQGSVAGLRAESRRPNPAIATVSRSRAASARRLARSRRAIAIKPGARTLAPDEERPAVQINARQWR